MENILAKIHQWFSIPYKLHFSSIGNGPKIIFLHGIATSSKSWENLIPFLSQKYTCITIDLLGFGQSPKPGWYDYTPDEHIKSIQYTISRLKINEPFILVGHSMGSLLALHFANKHPKKIQRLVLLSPPIYLTKDEVTSARKVWRDALYGRAYSYLRTHKKITLKGASGLKKLALKNNPFSISEDTWLSFSRSLEKCIEKQSVVKDLEQLSCPIDIFYGSRDNLLIKANIAVLARFSNIKLHTVRSGHFISVSYARTVAELLYSP